MQPSMYADSVKGSDLPPLPTLGGDQAPLLFGDWLALVAPAMFDIAQAGREWWGQVIEEVETLYSVWLQASPLQRLRLRPAEGTIAPVLQRVEMKGVNMLLQVLPESIKRDVVASRTLSSASIMFKLYTLFQPGGSAEKAGLLKQIAEPKIHGNGPDLLQSIRTWRRWLARTRELNLVLPDSMILAGVLGRFSDALSKCGNAQLGFRLSTARQELGIDHRPTRESILEMSEYLQAEAEELTLSIGHKTSAPATTQSSTTTPAVKALNYGQNAAEVGETEKARNHRAPCRFWKSEEGCRKGAECTYLHEATDMKGRCYGCGSTSHVKRECPVKKAADPTARTEKVKKVQKPKPEKGEKGASSATTPLKDEKKDSKKVEPVGEPPTTLEGTGGTNNEPPTRSSDAAGGLLTEATALLKSLRSMKAVRVKRISSPNSGMADRVALLDGGATHGLRQATEAELKDLVQIEVELASGTTWLFRHPSHRTLLSKDPVEAIIPLHRLVSLGYQINWSKRGCRIKHPVRGIIECVLRNGCPVLPEDDGLALLAEMEKQDFGVNLMDEETLKWWKHYFPKMPEEVIAYMKGQDASSEDASLCPWNRRQRRVHERSKGIVVNLFSGPKTEQWTKMELRGYCIINVDISNGSQYDLRNPGVWSYLCSLARRGRLVGILGGPPCRTVSRLRHRRPGPRPVRGRGEYRWALPHLQSWEQDLAFSDAALLFKQCGLWILASVGKQKSLEPFFIMENPQDPLDYMPKETQEENYPSYWDFEEIQELAIQMGARFIKFDQGPMGHARRKPTTLMVANAPGMEQLDGISGDGSGDVLEQTLDGRLRQSKTWAAWAPGLMAAIQESLSTYLSCHAEALVSEEESQGVTCKKMDLDSWKAHVQQEHHPFRRDCRVCMTTMGIDDKHRRHLGGSSSTTQSYCMSTDVVGPFIEGYDLGMNEMGKYLLVSTVSVPDLRTEECQAKDSQKGGDESLEDAATAEPDGNLGGLLEDPEVLPEVPLDAVEKLNLKNKVKLLAEPVKHQNITLVEVMLKRDTDSILAAMSKHYAKFKMMGLPLYRVHTDRATPFLTSKMARWCEQKELVQTMTGGDDGAGNGRVEAEIGQLKRRLRATLTQSGLPQSFWPCCARHIAEARLRQQLTKLGVPCRPMPAFASQVVVKTKRWHKSGQLSNPFRPMQLMGPSPLMTNGWVVRTEDQIQHARAVIVTDPLSHTAHVELQAGDNPGRPTRRHHGKQPLDGVENPLANLFPIEATSMAELHPSDPPDGPAVEEHGPDLPHDALDLADDYFSGTPIEDVEELALRELRARGESFWSGSMEMSSQMSTCEGCGLVQPLKGGRCGFCDQETPGLGELQPTWWPLEQGEEEKLYEQDLEYHWNLKKLWNKQLATPAVGDRAGQEHGGFLEQLEEDVRTMEEELEIQQSTLYGARLAALQGDSSMEVEALQQPAAVLQTYTVPLGTVRKELPEWKDAMAAELRSLMETTKAIRKVEESELTKFPNYQELEMAPAKVVATVKAPSGRRKVRVVICGNLLEKLHRVPGSDDVEGRRHGDDESSRFAQYAGGVDGTTLRCVLRKSAAHQWAIGTTDVRTAFLLAPRQNSRLLVCHPPRVLIEAGLCTSTERWVVDGAMYGLPESPKDWGCYRDLYVSSFRWTLDEKEYQLRRTPEPNVWYIARDGFHAEDQDEVCGLVTIYVDDILVTAPQPLAKAALDRIQQEWTCSEVEWVNSESWTKFCGVELRRDAQGLLVGQPSYVKELLERHSSVVEQSSPMPSTLDETLEENPDIQDIRAAQGIVGELLWASVRTRPDLCYGVAWMGRMVTKCPRRVLQYGRFMVGYLKKTADMHLRYGEWSGGFGHDDELAFARTSTCLEVFCDASYGVSGGKGQTGVITCYGGAPVHWQSKQQPFGTLSTTECELVGYAEAFTLGEATASLINILEQNKLEDGGTKVLYGDSQSGLLLLHSPDGAHRTRHLRLRHFVLRERIRLGDWLARHMSGKNLMADLLTKPIATKSQWLKFYDFLGMVGTVGSSTQSGEVFPTGSAASVVTNVGPSVAKIAGCVAVLGALAKWEPVNEGPKLAKSVGLAAVAAFTAHLIGGSIKKTTSKEDLIRAARLAVKLAAPGPSVASPRAEAPGNGGEVKTRKVSRLDELAQQESLSWENEPGRSIQIKALKSSGPPRVEGHGAEAMASSRPFGPPFDFWPLCDDRYNEAPSVGKDRWTSLKNGWWVKEHKEWRVRSFSPAHRNAPFSMHDLTADRFTTTFWRSSTGGWLQQIHHDSWIDPPRDMLPRDPRTGRSPQWLGFSFFKMKEADSGAGSSGDRRGPGAEDRGDPPAEHREGHGGLQRELAQGVVAAGRDGDQSLGDQLPRSSGTSKGEELQPPGRIGRGVAAARGRAAMGPITLRGSIARAFPGGVLPDARSIQPSQAEGVVRTSLPAQPSSGGTESIMYNHLPALRGPYRGQDGPGGTVHEGAETESRSSDPVTEIVHEPISNDPYQYMLSHVRDLAEQLAWSTGETVPPIGSSFPMALEHPPNNGVRPKVTNVEETVHGRYFNDGLFVEPSPHDDEFSDTLSTPGEAIFRLLGAPETSGQDVRQGQGEPLPLQEPAGPQERDQRFNVFDFRWRPPQGGGENIEIHSQPSEDGSNHGFEMLDE